MLCPNCEYENRDDARFCDECGFPLSGAIARAAGSASPKQAPAAPESRPESRPSERVDSRPASQDLPPTRNAAAFEGQVKASYRWDDYENTQASRGQRDPWEERARTVSREEPRRSAWPAVPDSYGHYSNDSEKTAALEPVSPAKRSVAQAKPQPVLPEDDEPEFDYDQLFSDDRPEPRKHAAASPHDEEPDLPDTLEFDEGFWRNDAPPSVPRPGVAHAPARKNYRAMTVKKGMDTRTVAIIAAGALIAVAAIVGIVGFLLGLWGGKIVPDVAGKSEVDARVTLEEEGFATHSVQVKSDETEGLVIGTDPSAGAHAPEGSEVTLNIAVARFVPEVVGMSRDEAGAVLQEAGYENVKYEPEYMDGDEGIVTSVSPEAGTRAKGSMELVVKYSKHYEVPVIDGLDVDAAVKAIEDAGLIADVVYIDTDQYPDNTIMSTDPQPGTQVSQGDTVSLTVSRTRGIELVALTEELFSEGSTVTIGGVDYQIESVISMSYQGDDVVAYTASAKPYVTFFGETLYASASQTVSGQVTWSSDNEVVSIE